MKNLLWFSTIAMFLFLFSCNEKEQKAPNILFIMSDDHTSQAFGIYGSRLANLNPTPNLDKIANEGMIFENAFCNNSICTPSRASIITGQYPQTNGVLDLSAKLDVAKQYLPQEMNKLGYETAIIGKWHLRNPPELFSYYNVLPGQGNYFNPVFYNREDGGIDNLIEYEGHSSDVITDISLNWLKNKRNKNKPFFLMHHFKAPHDMFINAPRYDSYLEDVNIPEPDNLFQPLVGSVGSKGYGSGLTKNSTWGLGRRLEIDNSLSEIEYVKATYQKYLKRYLRCVKGIDDNVKRLINYLEKSGELDNTVIIYTGDQGFFLG